MRNRIWIFPEIFSWPRENDSGEYLNESEWKRAHDIWLHASMKLQLGAGEMDRTDAITTLKRCLNQRLKQIEKDYKLRSFLGSTNNRYLQLLEQLDLVRPLMLHELMELRNEIEHEDKKPPKLDRCLEILDMIWYFLKTTDRFSRIRADGIMFELPDKKTHGSPYWVHTDIHIRRIWKIRANGWLPEEYISMKALPDRIEVLAEKVHTNEKWKKQGQHRDKKDTDLYFYGEIVNIPDKMTFVRQYFSAY